MGQLGEVIVDHKVLRLKELAKANTKFPTFHTHDGELVWSCVGCGDTIPDDLAFKGQWCDTCWAVLKLEAGYDD